jgi:RHS repeat-associated protein
MADQNSPTKSNTDDSKAAESKDASSTSERSPFAAPQINLPKGGGAIRGIGEKFEANAATGTGKLTVPLALSPGRSGFGPQLALSYDSGSGNGPVGVGCSMSTPAVSRKTDKGLPRYRNRETEECDVFILSGAEDLVPVLIQEEDGKWVNDEFQIEGYSVKRYRPRIEGLFARIERWTRLEDGDKHWRSISRDNTLTVYGRNEASRVFDPLNHRHVFSWLICESYDDKGNAILYEYVGENGDGVDLANASEHRRSRTAARYLKRILYGNRTPLLLDEIGPQFRRSHLHVGSFDTAGWMFEAVFDYGDGNYRQEQDGEGRTWVHCSSRLQSDSQWPVRKDPFSTYRSGFEVRTYRLCRRVLMFHHFPEESTGADCLVRSTEFEYRQKALGSFITQVTQSGYVRHEHDRYLKKSMPPLALNYTSSPLEDERYRSYQVKDVDPSRGENLPAGIDGANYRWVDLDGEGISGVLSEQGNSWYYKPNAGGGHFGPTELVARQPSLAALNQGAQQLLDLAGDGSLDLVQFNSPTPGFYERTLDEGWGRFRAFRSLPILDWNDPNLRFVDVTGDGIADILITEDDAFFWHPSLLDDGFGPAIRVAVPAEELQGPHVIFSDGVQSIYLADMSGDGLSDLVRIRNGEVCYWPNLGYGEFGAKVSMDHAPWFEDDDLFEQSRVKLADTDGSGTTDIVYLASDGIRIYLNQAGNGWSEARVLPQFAPVNGLTSISVVDFLGLGTACLLWSSMLPGDARRPLRYIDLMDGQKPHLLTQIENNLGAETRIEYASSTEFYLADKAAGKPWLTRLPFPVHCVKRVETYDFVSRNRFVGSYTYHHGFFDGLEREFRGFGRVEQLDTEQFATLSTSDEFPAATNLDRASSVPPVLTKTWFHTGVFLGNGRVTRHLAHEYYREPTPPHGSGASDPLAAMLLDDSIIPEALSAEEAREACRALKGSMLRQEVYALDDQEESGRPYTVTESNSNIVHLQPRGENLHAVFFVHPREVLTFNYERRLYDIAGTLRADPRVGHSVTLATDDYGNILRSAVVGYGRRFADTSALLTDEDRAKQQQILVTFTENRYTNPVLGLHAYRTPSSAETRTYELIHAKPSAVQPGGTNLFRFEELRAQIAHASDGTHDIPYEDVAARGATSSVPYRRLIEESRSYYRADRLDRILPLGEIEALALPGQGFQLAFTPGLLEQVYRRPDPVENLVPDVSHVLHQQGRYVNLTGDGRWWVPTGRIFYALHEGDTAAELERARRHFFLPQRFLDQFGNVTTAIYDSHDLMPVQVRDAVGNTQTSKIDYRVLATSQTTDPNRNRSHVAFDALGMVVGTAVMGKQGQRAGDSLDGFEPDLEESTVLEHFANPLQQSQAILKLATTRVLYDFWAYSRSRNDSNPQPAAICTLVRETHAADLRCGEHTRIQHSFSYSDGFGRTIQKKRQTEPGPLVVDGPEINPRWIGTGWTIFNNKGKPVRQYEPFFSDSQSFEFAKTIGVSPIVYYDPLGRVVATIHANHTYEKVSFDPWNQAAWDVNDTVLEEQPTLDPDVGNYFARLADADFLPTWYTQRIRGDLGKEEQRAALNTAAHANTPHMQHFDSLGRAFLAVDHNRVDRDGVPVEEFFAIRTEMDIEGNHRAMIDALGRVAARYDYDMLSSPLRLTSIDGGTRWTLNDSAGKSMLTWDSRMHRVRREYDALRRPTSLYLRTCEQPEILAERVVYGEGQPNDLALNLRNKPFREFDGAGIVTNERFDFKGNLLQSSRQLLEDYKGEIDWTQDLELEERSFTRATTYDALNRLITVATPDNSVARPKYNEANQLKALSVQIRGATEATPFVTHINYDAKGQRQTMEYGNGVRTRYAYDPLTFRMVHLLTSRNEDRARLQNLHYVFDPVGNITSIRDDAQETVYFDNQVVSPINRYVYDAVYRLISADGREHAGVVANSPIPSDDAPRMDALIPADGRSLRRYSERYDYDPVGNIVRLLHSSHDTNWSRHFAYGEFPERRENDRLTRSTVGQTVEAFTYDADGNMTAMPHLSRMAWDFKDQLHITRRQVARTGPGETTYYVYNSDGQRVRKVTERASGSRKHERAYLGGFEIYRRYDSVGRCVSERETLHVMDDQRRIALLETKTIDDEARVKDARPLQRLQLHNHLESSVLELDAEARVISYEEYYPYGSTSYQATDRHIKAARKRYRYTGKEHDRESGFYYHGARYYLPWLGRWANPDPTGMRDGTNLYRYGAGNPISYSDPTGTVPKPDPYLLKSTGSRIIGDYPGYAALWKDAVNKVLGPKFGGKDFAENLAKFEEHIAEVEKLKGLGSNRAKGTAINVARKTYSRVRSEFGKLLQKEGVSLKGYQVHHALGNRIGTTPGKALDASGLAIAKGNASTPGTEHNLWHERDNTLPGANSEAKNAEKVAATEAKTTGQEAIKAAGTEGKEAIKVAAKESETIVAKTGVKEALNVGEKTGLKTGAKFLGKKAAKFIPFVGIGVGVGLVANDWRKGDWKSLAWDAAEAIPVVGDVVGAGHLGIETGTVLNEGLGIDKVAAEHGEAVEHAATAIGIPKDAAMILGATGAALSSITIAPQIALNRTITKWFQ